MVCFSVIICILDTTHINQLFAVCLSPIFQLLHIDTLFLPSILHGFWEITLGIQTTAALHGPLPDTVAFIACILAWSGVSIQMQIAAITAPAGLSLKTYFCSRILQSILSGITVLLWFPPLPTAQIFFPEKLFTSPLGIILTYWGLLIISFLLLFLITTAGVLLRLLKKLLF